MKKEISAINILIALGLILTAYLGYTGYLADKIKRELSRDTAALNKTGAGAPAEKNYLPITGQSENKQTEQPAAPPTTPVPSAEPSLVPGYFRNQTYLYEISYPKDWPIKVRSSEDVVIGTVPPKNGQGAIAITVTAGGGNEIEQVKAEAKKYPGLISISEQPASLAGLDVSELIINNLAAKLKTIYFYLKKDGRSFTLSYSEESPEFAAAASQAIKTFKFYK